MKKKEIFFCNLNIQYKGKKYLIERVVYKETDGYYLNTRELKKIGITEKVKVLKFDIINSLGYENESKGFTEVKASDEKRNKITGTYE
tara:strand:+ start:88 stop:351 length:264 start_codon:yes stop_codon:yes gene_type:complete